MMLIVNVQHAPKTVQGNAATFIFQAQNQSKFLQYLKSELFLTTFKQEATITHLSTINTSVLSKIS